MFQLFKINSPDVGINLSFQISVLFAASLVQDSLLSADEGSCLQHCNVSGGVCFIYGCSQFNSPVGSGCYDWDFISVLPGSTRVFQKLKIPLFCKL
jgi:hypothetical protein